MSAELSRWVVGQRRHDHRRDAAKPGQSSEHETHVDDRDDERQEGDEAAQDVASRVRSAVKSFDGPDNVRRGAKQRGKSREAGRDRGQNEGVGKAILDVVADRVGDAAAVAGELVDKGVNLVAELARGARLDAVLVRAGAPVCARQRSIDGLRTDCRASGCLRRPCLL